MSKYPSAKPHRSSRRQPRAHVHNVSGAEMVPGAIRPVNVSRRRVNLSDLTSGNFINGYNPATTGEYTLAADPGWSRPGGANQNKDLRVQLGYIDTPLQCDFKGQIGVSNNSVSTDFQARLCAVLYTSNRSSGGVYQRSEAISSIWLPTNNHTYTLPLNTSFIIPASSEVTDDSTGEPADWYFGFQLQQTSAANKGGFQNKDQSITCTFYAAPFYGNDDNQQDGSEWNVWVPRTLIDAGLT